MTRYASLPTDAIRTARTRLLAGLENPRLTGANRERTLSYLREAEAELVARASTSKVALVQSGWQSQPIAPNAEIDKISDPKTGELLGWVRTSRYSTEAYDANDRLLGEYRGVDAATRAADRVWRVAATRQATA